MNTTDHTKLADALCTLPEGFTFDSEFINYRVDDKWCRVIRIVGKRRHLVLFSYQNKEQDTCYLDCDNMLKDFTPRWVHQVYNEEHGHNVSWDRAVGEWLDGHEAAWFTGRGWTSHCARSIHDLITRWKKHYAGNIGFERRFRSAEDDAEYRRKYASTLRVAG